MAKIKYRICDVCGDTLKTDVRCLGYINGYAIWNRLFNKLDICDECLKKIKYLSIDIENEEKYVHEFFEKEKKYDDPDMQSAYYDGLEDALSILSQHRLEKVKKKI